MANLTDAEFNQAVQAMVDHYGLERLRDRFAKMGAFTNRRGLNTPAALADRLYRLTGGLRRQAIPTFAFSSLWGEMLQAKLGEDGEKKLEQLADKVNECLTKDEQLAEGKEGDLERALATLPPGARAVFVLHDVEGRTHEEIAALLNLAAGTSKAQLHRARRLLREALES